MFTGIIEEIGRIRQITLGRDGGQLAIAATQVLAGTQIGDSIAVNGVCLTVTSLQRDGFTAEVMRETLHRTNLGELATGHRVNLERALAANGRFGGHLVSGHIDGVGRLQTRTPEGNATRLTLTAPSALLDLIIPKGSVALDGVSLTVAQVDEKGFQVCLIPHTSRETTLPQKPPGAACNIENDLIGKYVQKLLHPIPSVPAPAGISWDLLRQQGF